MGPMHKTDAGAGHAAADGYVYWATEDANSIGRAKLDGTGADPSVITGASNPSDLTVTASAG